jgi:hypothetical protein
VSNHRSDAPRKARRRDDRMRRIVVHDRIVEVEGVATANEPDAGDSG